MKKSCLVALGALVACIGAANAASLKDTCLANPSKFVWVEKNQDCVPISPCSQPKGSQYYKLYCNDMWAETDSLNQRETKLSYVQAKAQADWYIKHVLKDSGGCIAGLPFVKPVDFDHQYVKCTTGKGDYMEFKIGTSGSSIYLAIARCEAMGKVYKGLRWDDDVDYGGDCVGATKEQCKNLAEGLKEIIVDYDPECSSVWRWVDPYVDWEGEMKEGHCFSGGGCL